jgi:hypothetical protein
MMKMALLTTAGRPSGFVLCIVSSLPERFDAP